MSTPHTLVGIDVGTTKVCALIGEVGEGGALQIVGVGVSPSRGLRKGNVVNVAETIAAIAAAVERAERISGYEIGRAYVSLAGEHVSALNSRGVVAITRSDHAIDQEHVERALADAQAIAIPHNRQVIHIIPRGYTLDGQEGVHSPTGMYGFKLEVEAHIITASAASVQNLAQCVRGAGVEVDEFVINPLASGEAVLSPSERNMGVVLADIGGGTTDIGIFIDGTLWHTAILPVGGNQVTNDIAMGLRLPFDTAEAIKIEHGHALPDAVPSGATFSVKAFGDNGAQTISRRDLAVIISARVEEIFELILREIKRSGYDSMLPAGVVLCGGTSLLPGIRELGREVLGLPVRIATPGDLSGLTDTLSSPAYATSVGLLRWGMREDTLVLRPHERERVRRGLFSNRIKGVLKALLPG
jgi:cell division protein FtsA